MRPSFLETSKYAALQLKQSRFAYYFIAAALSVAYALSFVSWLRLCSQACAEGHTYRIFGFTFETIGLIFFPFLMLLHLLSRRFMVLGTFTSWLLSAALGSELIFIYVQKYKIGSWCPICLAIASMLAVAGMACLYSYYRNFKLSFELGDKGQLMNNICKGFTGCIFFVMGFILAFAGVAKSNPLRAEEASVKESIAFGNLRSPIEVFVFTDWRCPSCRKLEPTLEYILPRIMQTARVTFVDDPIHPETMNFTPYNVSFMINNKAQYFSLRKALTALSEDTKTPTDAEIEAIAAKLGTQYRQLNYADVALANKYFASLVKKMDIDGTPIIVVANRHNNKAKKLEGSAEITEKNILKAIETLSQAK